MRLTMTLPVPPTLNHAYFTAKNGQRILTKDAKWWIRTARGLAVEAKLEQGWQTAVREKVVLEITTYLPDNRRRDVTNLGKLLYDALEGIIYDDDRYCLPRYQDWQVDKKDPRVEIVAYRLSGYE